MSRSESPFLIRTKGKFIVCKDCGKPVGECAHTEGDLPTGFEVAVELWPGGPTIPAYVDRLDTMFEMELVEERPMTQPSGSIFFQAFDDYGSSTPTDEPPRRR